MTGPQELAAYCCLAVSEGCQQTFNVRCEKRFVAGWALCTSAAAHVQLHSQFMTGHVAPQVVVRLQGHWIDGQGM